VSNNPPSLTGLIVVDVQRAFDEWEAAGRRRNNPQIIASRRRREWPAISDSTTMREAKQPHFHFARKRFKVPRDFVPGKVT
jgi:hypothetical protein